MIHRRRENGHAPVTKLRIRTLLVAILIAPMTLIAGISADRAVRAYQDAETADQIATDAGYLRELGRLRLAFLTEQIATELIMRSSQLDISKTELRLVFGGDAFEALRKAREDTDAMIASGVGRSQRDEIESVRIIRPAIDNQSKPPDEVTVAFSELDWAIANEIDDRIGALLERSRGLSRESNVSNALEGQRWASVIVGSSRQHLGIIAALSLGVSLPGRDNEALLVRHQTLITLARGELQHHARGATLEALVDLVETESTDRFMIAVNDALAGRPIVDRSDRIQIAILVNAGTARQQAVFRLSSFANEEVAIEGERVSRASRADFRLAIVVLVALMLTAIAIGAIANRRISRPLSRLARRVNQLDGFTTDQTEESIRGTHEINVVRDAIEELAAHLTTVDRQLRALADGNLDDPELQQTTSGSLGASVNAAMQKLSTSMAEQRALHERIAYEANHDTLTGLPNRNATMRLIDEQLHTMPPGSQLSAVFIDADDFKRINHQHGHSTGDEVLKALARRLRTNSRDGDRVARFGGDEFLVIRTGDAADVDQHAQRVLALFEEPVATSQGHFSVHVSIGAATAGPDGDSTTLLREADVALREAKRLGKRRAVAFNDSLRRKLQVQEIVRDDLARALANNALEVHYQPIIDMKSRRITSLEALLRWPTGEPDYRSPSVFIPAAEATDLIVDIDRWVLQQAARQIARWQEADSALNGVNVSVNLSGRHLTAPGLATDLLTIVEAEGARATDITFELTETVLINDLDTVSQQLSDLRSRGFGVAIDDFGTGFTSLAHLRCLPASTLKIDKTLIDELNSKSGRTMTALVVKMGESLGMSVVAEGVEREEQFKTLQSLGCSRVQGWLFAAAMGPAELEAFTMPLPS